MSRRQRRMAERVEHSVEACGEMPSPSATEAVGSPAEGEPGRETADEQHLPMGHPLQVHETTSLPDALEKPVPGTAMPARADDDDAPDIHDLFRRLSNSVPPELKQMILAYGPRDGDAPNLYSKTFLAQGGWHCLTKLLSSDAGEREGMEQAILADELATSYSTSKRLDLGLAAYLNDDRLLPDLSTLERIVGIRDVLSKRISNLIVTRRALSRPGPVNSVKIQGGEGLQQIVVGCAPDHGAQMSTPLGAPDAPEDESATRADHEPEKRRAQNQDLENDA
jgi:hypothetical protein